MTEKRCPLCGSASVVQAAYCRCGHWFEIDDGHERPPVGLVARAEALYESHLRARLQRAARAARFAKMDALRDPDDSVKLDRLRETEQEIKLLQAQLAMQSARAATTRAATGATPAEPTCTPTGGTDPAETFRAAQTAKAEQTFELLRLQIATQRQHSGETSGAFRALQAQKARALATGSNTVKFCPGCGEAVTLAMRSCNCGYVLRVSDTESADELATSRDHV